MIVCEIAAGGTVCNVLSDIRADCFFVSFAWSYYNTTCNAFIDARKAFRFRSDCYMDARCYTVLYLFNRAEVNVRPLHISKWYSRQTAAANIFGQCEFCPTNSNRNMFGQVRGIDGKAPVPTLSDTGTFRLHNPIQLDLCAYTGFAVGVFSAWHANFVHWVLVTLDLDVIDDGVDR